MLPSLFPTLETLLLPDHSFHRASPAPTFHVHFCLVAFAGIITSTSCAAYSSLEPLVLQICCWQFPPVSPFLWTIAALQVCLSEKKGDFGLITTSFGTSKPGHREELEPGV